MAALRDAATRVAEQAEQRLSLGGLAGVSATWGARRPVRRAPWASRPTASAIPTTNPIPTTTRRAEAVYAGPVQDLIDELGRLPGIGPKSAQRIAFHLLKLPKEDAVRLARVIIEVKEKISFCNRCFNVAEGELCDICRDPRRDATVLCVVEEPRDIVAIEKTHDYPGRLPRPPGSHQPDRGGGSRAAAHPRAPSPLG